MLFGILKSSTRLKPLFLGADENTTTYIGHDTEGRPIGMAPTQMKSHVLITGTTGAGKTEALLSLMSNAFATGSGGVMVDGKGDVAAYAKMYAMADYFDRRDDLYVINFMAENSTSSLSPLQISHRFNPFEKGSAEALAGLLTKMFEDPSTPAMWTGRASAMLSALMRMLCWLRDEKGRYLDVAVIRDSIRFQALFDLAYSEEFADAPEKCRAALRAYLSSLGAFAVEKGYDQSQETLNQQAYIEMQLTRTLGIMADVYGHIFAAGGSDVDIEDIVKNRRFLLVMLPALEKSRDEIAMLGKIVVAALQTMASSLLWVGEASPETVAEVGLTHGRDDRQPPFLCILDEATYYAVSGFDLLAAQARSLGISLVISCQDIQSLFDANSQVARAIVACTATKIIMRTECWHSALDDMIVSSQAGRDDVVRALSRRRSSNLFGSARRFAAGQSEGEFILLNSGKMIVGKSIYFDIREVKHLVLAVPRFRCVERAAKNLLSLVEETQVEDDAGIPRIVAALSGDSDGSATDALSTALASLHPTTAKFASVVDVVRIGE
jgi:hypothetical protein